MFICGGCAWLKTVKTKYQYAHGALQCASMLLTHTERERANVYPHYVGVHLGLLGPWRFWSAAVSKVLRQCGL